MGLQDFKILQAAPSEEHSRDLWDQEFCLGGPKKPFLVLFQMSRIYGMCTARHFLLFWNSNKGHQYTGILLSPFWCNPGWKHHLAFSPVICRKQRRETHLCSDRSREDFMQQNTKFKDQPCLGSRMVKRPNTREAKSKPRDLRNDCVQVLNRVDAFPSLAVCSSKPFSLYPTNNFCGN